MFSSPPLELVWGFVGLLLYPERKCTLDSGGMLFIIHVRGGFIIIIYLIEIYSFVYTNANYRILFKTARGKVRSLFNYVSAVVATFAYTFNYTVRLLSLPTFRLFFVF